MPPKTKLWKREPHTEGKHLVLQGYLKAWLPIVGSWNTRILFIDGFAGPGEYEGGEEGSPVVAMRTLVEHAAKQVIRAEVVFVFIEENEERAEHLEGLVEQWRPRLPDGAKVHVVQGTFDRSLAELFDQLDEQKRRLAPALVMIDPFGIKGTPMEVVERILSNRTCEVYVTFMYDWVNRFITTPEFEPHLTDLFGTDRWKEAKELSGEERRTHLYRLYEDQLRKAGAKQVVHFDLWEENRLVYSIFFGTQHHTGCDRMKNAIWKIAPYGDFSFRGSNQLVLGVDQPTYEPLKQSLMDRFAGEDWLTIEEVLEFVASDATEYHTSQVKRPALRPMEKAGLVEVDPESRKSWGFPERCRLRFKRAGLRAESHSG
jgi:three-Cys-motif partner protein